MSWCVSPLQSSRSGRQPSNLSPNPHPNPATASTAARLRSFDLLATLVAVVRTDGTVLFEKILDAGERYAVPPLQQAALLRSGNSGSIYFVVNGKTYGPAAPGAQVIKNVALSAEALTTGYQTADKGEDADLAKFISVADAVDPALGVPMPADVVGVPAE